MIMKKKKIAIVFGTRPEAIKMAPVILELSKNQDIFDTTVIVTAQHREMLDQVLKVFKITPDYDLNIMKRNQTLSNITSDVLQGIEKVLLREKPDMVLVHGDTTTSFASALAAYYQQIPIGHVEAGLRTYDKYFPFPEEANRQLIDNLSELFFVPTEATKNNLLNEGVSEEKITVTGNTVIDAIHYTKESKSEHPILKIMDESPDTKWILLTMHRRENHGIPMNNVFKALKKLVESREDVSLVMPVHMSPIVRQSVSNLLSGHERIHLVDPLEVDVFHKLINRAYLVMTDSGGLQEEAPALDVPVLVLRDKTERPEGLEAGTLRIVGTDEEKVSQELNDLLSNEKLYIKMSKAINPYGDGLASGRIVNEIINFFNEQ
ncbi:UDP-N-acetylglucosamine 2-epimerase (non-hydrolyzing) [Alkalibacterium sp. s-m-22]